MPPKRKGNKRASTGRTQKRKRPQRKSREKSETVAGTSQEHNIIGHQDSDKDTAVESEEDQEDSVGEEQENRTVCFDQVEAEIVDAVVSILMAFDPPPPPPPAVDKDNLINPETPDGAQFVEENTQQRASCAVGCQVGFYRTIQRELMREKLIKCILRMKRQLAKEVSSVKRKQWCIICGELAYYHCCRNANYCSMDCQSQHWITEHKKECKRAQTSKN